MDILQPLIDTFGIYYVIGTWLIIPSIFSTLALVSDRNILIMASGFFAPYLVWPINLWILKLLYDFIPMVRVIFGVDMTDLTVFVLLVILIYDFMYEVTDELTGVIEQ